MIDVFLSTRILTYLDEEGPLSALGPQLELLGDSVLGGLGKLEGLSDGVRPVSITSDRIVMAWDGNDGPSRLILDGAGLGIGADGVIGTLEQVRARVDGIVEMRATIAPEAISVRIGDAVLELGGAFTTAAAPYFGILNLLSGDDMGTDAGIGGLLGDGLFDLETAALGLNGLPPMFSISSLETSLGIGIGPLDISIEGSVSPELIAAALQLGLTQFAGGGFDLDAALALGDGLDSLDGLQDLEAVSITDETGALMRLTGGFDDLDMLGEVFIEGTAARNTLRMAGTVAERVEVQGKGGADRLAGGQTGDLIAGQRGGDRLWGNRGDDTLLGGPGRDSIRGGLGDDEIWGGSGADVIVIDSGDDHDRLFDFQAGIDTLVLSKHLWRDNYGNLSADEVVAEFASVGKAGNARLIFDDGTRVTLIGQDQIDTLADDLILY